MNELTRILSIALLVAVGERGHAYGGAADLNPLGKYADRPTGDRASYQGWKPEWSAAFFKCARQPEIAPAIEAISNGKMTDLGPGRKWCPNSDVFKPPNTSLMLLMVLKEIGRPESDFREDAINNKSPNPPATGVLQIGPSDAEYYQCKGPDGNPIYDGRPYVRGEVHDARVTALKDGGNNVCCGLKIIATKILKNKKASLSGTDQEVLTSHWQVARDGKGGHGPQIRSDVNRACQLGAFNNPGSYFTVAEVEQARKITTFEVGTPVTGVGATTQ
jgi:hypothetical protein